MSSPRLRVLTLNTWHGHLPRTPITVERIEPEGHKDRRRAALVAGLRALAPDVLLLQECMPQPDFSSRLARELGLVEVSQICNAGARLLGHGIPRGIGAGEGLAIMARPELTLKQLGVKRLSGVGFVSPYAALQLGQLRFALAAEVRVQGQPVVVFNTHLRYAYPEVEALHASWRALAERGEVTGEPHRGLLRDVEAAIRVRDGELARLRDWMARWVTRGVPVMLGADLNLDHDATQVRGFAERLGLLNVLPTVSDSVVTWDPQGNPNVAFSVAPTHTDGADKGLVYKLVAHYDGLPQSPDHLLLGPTFTRQHLLDGGRAFDRPFETPAGQVYASDHYGVWADVALAG